MTPFEHAVAATRGARDYQEDSAGFIDVSEAEAFAEEIITVTAEGSARRSVPNPDRTLQRHGGLAVLADGMGGHAGGALASRLVCENFLATAAEDGGGVTDKLQRALVAANAALAEKVRQDPLLSGMGSTLIGASFGDDGVEWVSVGDSPLYLFRRGEIAVLNEDHSLAPELDRLVAAGRLTEQEARRDPRRHMLRSAVTGEEIDLIDLSGQPLPLETGDYVVLASDGIATLEPGEIARVIQAYAADGANAVATALIRAVEAIREPHQDNATVLVVRKVAD